MNSWILIPSRFPHSFFLRRPPRWLLPLLDSAAAAAGDDLDDAAQKVVQALKK
jgi:hypothetical protein